MLMVSRLATHHTHIKSFFRDSLGNVCATVKAIVNKAEVFTLIVFDGANYHHFGDLMIWSKTPRRLAPIFHAAHRQRGQIDIDAPLLSETYTCLFGIPITLCGCAIRQIERASHNLLNFKKPFKQCVIIRNLRR